ncbi:thioredoxin family protein [Candidatus Woesearchaeota archaeon]|nr:thioredoxin family protein [Candidatus Woesearchaeota archaeon]
MANIKKTTIWQIATGILAVLLVVSIFTNGFGGAAGGSMSEGSAVDKALTFINENMLQEGMTAELKDSADESGLYKFKIDISGQEYDSYVTKDGKMLFTAPGVDLDQEIEAPEAQGAAVADVTKSDKPAVEVFVMSHCPYGTQIEKGMIPVVKLLGDKIDFNLRFVNYAMHGEKEVTEQTNQYCIAKEQNDKLIPYLECFLGDGDSEKCLGETGIDKAALDSCFAQADEEYSITENLEDESSWLNGRFPKFMIYDELNTKYGIRGSPGLVVNGQQVSSGRSPSALLATICNAFNDAPAECSEELDSANPSPGFGYEASAGDSSGSCG